MREYNHELHLHFARTQNSPDFIPVTSMEALRILRHPQDAPRMSMVMHSTWSSTGTRTNETLELFGNPGEASGTRPMTFISSTRVLVQMR